MSSKSYWEQAAQERLQFHQAFLKVRIEYLPYRLAKYNLSAKVWIEGDRFAATLRSAGATVGILLYESGELTLLDLKEKTKTIISTRDHMKQSVGIDLEPKNFFDLLKGKVIEPGESWTKTKKKTKTIILSNDQKEKAFISTTDHWLEKLRICQKDQCHQIEYGPKAFHVQSQSYPQWIAFSHAKDRLRMVFLGVDFDAKDLTQNIDWAKSQVDSIQFSDER
ncbi:MAG: hypothetical protein KDD52_05930 [Bdellovibrionales bacterium]|nr:hypothetical protein [Bdellovibrionales bacterium]